MKPISINSRKFLGGYVDTQSRKQFPDVFLCSGLLLFVVLVTILYSAGGGPFSLMIVACVLVLGSGIAVILRCFPYRIPSCVSGTITITPSTKQPMPKAA